MRGRRLVKGAWALVGLLAGVALGQEAQTTRRPYARRTMTVALDFDGVIHSYRSGWTGIVPTDPPTRGAREAIATLREHYRVVVFSSRCRSADGVAAIRAWLEANGITVDDVVTTKPPAVLVVDDRAHRFDGRWAPVLERCAPAHPERLEPWNRQEAR